MEVIIVHLFRLALIALTIGVVTLVIEKWPRKAFCKKRNLHDHIWVVH